MVYEFIFYSTNIKDKSNLTLILNDSTQKRPFLYG